MSIGRLSFLADEDKYLNIAPGLKLPYDITTLTIGFLAMRGSGKTYAGMVLVEEMILHGLHVVCIDLVGVMWGLRSSADGKSEGLPVIILGGDHGDVPLETSSGAAVADFIMESRQCCVLDLSLFRKGEQNRFMTDFAERLYHKNRNPIHLVVDECDAFMPQKPMHEQARLLGAMEDLVRRGRARGIGLTLISQRPAVINKNCLTQVECLVVLRMTGPQDIAAIKQWIHHHGTEEDQEKVLSSLSSLPRGTGWFWSPGWMKVLKKIEIRRRRTFDSSATPAPGKTIVLPEELAKVDLVVLKEKLAATIERAKEDDPAALKARVKELEDKLKTETRRAVPQMHEVVREVERVPTYLYAELLERWGNIGKTIDALARDQHQTGQRLELLREENQRLGTIVEKSRFAPSVVKENGKRGVLLPATGLVIPASILRDEKTRSQIRGLTDAQMQSVTAGDTTRDRKTANLRGERRVLLALAELGGAADRRELAVASCYKYSAGGFQNILSSLRSQKLIEGHQNEIRLTDVGTKFVSENVMPRPNFGTTELRTEWSSKLDKPARLALEVLAHAHPKALTKKEIAERTGYVASAGGFQNGLSQLRANALVEGTKELKLARVLA